MSYMIKSGAKLRNKLLILIFFICFLHKIAFAKILRIDLEGPITPPISDFVELAINKAEKENMKLLLITLNTPGGLEKSMRDISNNILASKVPVCVYVYPSGARATSAGAIIALSAHILAMASGTTIGSAHPINIFGEIKDKNLEKKIVNDLKAYAMGLAEIRGKNKDIAGALVDKSLSMTAFEAKEKSISDLVEDDLSSLIIRIDGFSYKQSGNVYELKIMDNTIIEFDMPLYLKISNYLAQPNLAYLFLIFGLLCIFFELSNPGLYVPALIGILLILLSFYGFHLLSANMTGIFLIILGMVLLIAEVYITSFGLLGLSGIASLVVGNILLYKSLGGAIKLDIMYMLIVVIIIIVIAILVLFFGLKAQFMKPLEGIEALIGEEGEVYKKITSDKGKVFVHGEIWNARFLENVSEKEKVRVVGVKRNILQVKKIEDEKPL
jgi:membrane-bound serine protease (ClpP class)